MSALCVQCGWRMPQPCDQTCLARQLAPCEASRGPNVPAEPQRRADGLPAERTFTTRRGRRRLRVESY